MKTAYFALCAMFVLTGCSPRHNAPVYSSSPSEQRIDIANSRYEAPALPKPVFVPTPPPSYLPSPEPQKEPVKTVVSGKDFTVSDITAKMSKIDDIGLVFVRSNDGNLVLAQSAAWKYGLNGSASGSLNQYLTTGTNLVIFALYNHQAKKLAIDKPFFNQFSYSVLDKWHYEFSLFGDGTAIFNNASEGKEGDAGVMDWLAFSVESNNGQFVVSRASDSQRTLLKIAFNKINADFLKHPVSDSVADIAAAIAVGIRTGVTGSN